MCIECDFNETYYNMEIDQEKEIVCTKSNKKATRRRNNYKKDKRLRRILNTGEYAPHIGYLKSDESYIKYPKNSKTQKWMKRLTSKKIRKNRSVPNGNQYRKEFDYWWTLY